MKNIKREDNLFYKFPGKNTDSYVSSFSVEEFFPQPPSHHQAGGKDTSFNIGNGFNNTVFSLVIQSDGKIVVGGGFTTYSGSSANRIIRLNTDGTKDTGFNIGTGFNNIVRSLVIQSDGKILAGGLFTTYSGSAANRIIRLNTNGTQDTGFNITGFNSIIQSLAIQSDGKILAGGLFTIFSGTSANRIIRLNTDGTKDTGFNIGAGFSSIPYSRAIQSDGKIVVGGDFTTYSGVLANRIIRLNADGTRDTSFTIGNGFNNTVFSLAIQSDGKILAGGDFITYSGASAIRIIRLYGQDPLLSYLNGGPQRENLTLQNFDFGSSRKSSIIIGNTYTFVLNFTNNFGGPTTSSTTLQTPFGFRAPVNADIASGSTGNMTYNVKFFVNP